MDSNKPLPPAAPSPVLLAEFRQRAEPILARERGFTPACLVKLGGLARQLGFAEDQIEDALRSLGAEAVPPPAPPNAQEEKFRRRLTKDLQGKTRSILGPTIEARIVEAAQRKYSISEATAREVFAEVAAALGLRRISADEAVRNLTTSIDQAAADSTWLARESRDRLRSAGLNWGLELDVVDELIEEKLLANKLDREQRRYWNRAVLSAAGGAVALVAVGLLVMFLSKKEEKPGPVRPAERQQAGSESKAPAATVSAPAWWDVDLTLAVAKARSKVKDFAPVYAMLVSAQAADRVVGYKQLVELAPRLPVNTAEREMLAEVIGGCYALEPDDACAAQLRESLFALIPAAEAPLPRSRSEYEVAYWAGRTCLLCLSRNDLPTGRRDVLALQFASATGASVNPALSVAESEKVVAAAVTRRLYAQLTNAAAKNAAGIAPLERYVAQQAQRHLSADEAARLEATFLASALSAPRVAWRDYQELIAATAASPDSLNVLKLLEVYERTADISLRDLLAELLLRRVEGKVAATASVREVARAVRQALGAASSPAANEADRWSLLRARVDVALARADPPADNHTQLLSHAVELAQLAALASALSQGDNGLVVFDELVRLEGAEKTAVAADPAASRDVFDVPEVRGPVRALGQAERQIFERLISQFENFAPLPSVQRESNMRALALLAYSLSDLSVRQAEAVAKYVLAEKQETERDSLMKPLAEIRRWKNLRLAVADGLERAKLPPAQCEQLSSALLSAEHQTPEGLARALKQSVLDDLQNDLRTSPEPAIAPSRQEERRAEVDRAAEALLEAYRTRARVLGVPAAEYQAVETPSQALQLGAASLGRQLRASSSRAEDAALVARLPHELVVADYLSSSDLQRTVALARVWLDLLARRVSVARPDKSAQIAAIIAKTEAAVASAANCPAQLHAAEAGQLHLWMLFETESGE